MFQTHYVSLSNSINCLDIKPPWLVLQTLAYNWLSRVRFLVSPMKFLPLFVYYMQINAVVTLTFNTDLLSLPPPSLLQPLAV